ncbi:MAG: DNA polymerase IV [Prolixibacteraceae bacterium]|nr:DNA polymerase IV [Prolixibacteraceae bacterium]
MIRKIIHIDMDAFFASVEQRDNPQLRGKPVAVGGSSNRGVIAAASYEARKYGIHSAMATVKAKQLCPQLIIVQSNREAYIEASRLIRSIFHKYTDIVEPLSIDEAFLDVTFSTHENRSATLLARKIKNEIHEATGLTASAGISYNKFLAKIASDINKPNGIFTIPPEDAITFLEKLEIGEFYGIGKASRQKFHELGIFNGKDLKKYSKKDLIQWFGKAGGYYYNIVRGIDNREVTPHRERKSIGAEKTFENDSSLPSELESRLLKIIDKLWLDIESKSIEAKTITLKIKFHDFESITRSNTLGIFIKNKKQLTERALKILRAEYPLEKPVRLLGVSLSNFRHELKLPKQMNLTF